RSHPNSSFSRDYFFYVSILFKEQTIGSNGTIFIKVGRKIIIVIKQYPLIFIIYNGMVVGPGARCRFIHNYAFVGKWPQWIITGSIFQAFDIIGHVGVGHIVDPVSLKNKGS